MILYFMLKSLTSISDDVIQTDESLKQMLEVFLNCRRKRIFLEPPDPTIRISESVHKHLERTNLQCYLIVHYFVTIKPTTIVMGSASSTIKSVSTNRTSKYIISKIIQYDTQLKMEDVTEFPS